jgi:hypothetical protein
VVAVQWVARAKSPVSNDALVMDGGPHRSVPVG